MTAPCGSGRCLRCGEPDPEVPHRYWPPAELVLAWAGDPLAHRAPGADLEVAWSMRGPGGEGAVTFVVDVTDGVPVRVLPCCSAAEVAADLAVEADISVTVAVLAGLVPVLALFREAAVRAGLDQVMCFCGVFESSGYLTATAPFRPDAEAFLTRRVAAEQAFGGGPSPSFLAALASGVPA